MEDDETPLFNACRSDNKELVEYLVEHGADIKYGNTPLFYVFRQARKEIVEYLGEHGLIK